MNKLLFSCSLLFLSFILLFSFNYFETGPSFGSDHNWADYLGGPDRNHYSKLKQIDSSNASKLQKAWEYALPDSGQMQANPLIIDGVLYGISATVQPFALDAATGKEIWRFKEKNKHWASTSRGVSYWTDGKDKRILFTAGSFLWALDADSGQPISSFGQDGKIDMHSGLLASAKDKFLISNTPGSIYKDIIIMPVRLSEAEDAAPGDIMAFNVKTGAVEWTFHTIPHPGEYGYSTFPKEAYKNKDIGAANNWCGMAVDHKRGLVFVPTGSAAYDFYGGNRKGQNLFANSLLALDATSGKRRWHFQTVHHDIWDRDHPSPPNLLSIQRNGKSIDVVAINTKNGYTYMFERETGHSIFPVKEIPVPASDIPGEKAWPTQPLPSWPRPFARQSYELKPEDISPYAQNRAELVEKLKLYRKAQFSPPSTVGTVIFPGYDGGAEWGGAAVDPNGIMYVNANEMAWINTLVPNAAAKALPKGQAVYSNRCQTCHGAELKGNPKSGYPSLQNINAKYDPKILMAFINQGKGMMPGFSYLEAKEKEALVAFLMGTEKQEVSGSNTVSPIKYRMTGYNKFLDDRGLPAIKPPWGTLSALDLNTGKYLWKLPLGDEPLLAKEGIFNTGTENYGGPIVTASGLLIIAATKDAHLRVFHAKSGKLIAKYTLPAAAFATPATYMVHGKQYVAVACGGSKLGTLKGNKYVAFALP
jgi:quinoprotein glucose dehydrogenase